MVPSAFASVPSAEIPCDSGGRVKQGLGLALLELLLAPLPLPLRLPLPRE